MNPDQNESQSPSEDQAAAVRAVLVERYGVDGEFIGVPALSRVLGVSQTALHDHIRKGRLAMPVRMFNKAPKVAVDDFVAWWLAGSDLLASEPAFRRPAPVPPQAAMSPRVRNAVRESLARLKL